MTNVQHQRRALPSLGNIFATIAVAAVGAFTILGIYNLFLAPPCGQIF